MARMREGSWPKKSQDGNQDLKPLEVDADRAHVETIT